MRIRSKLAALAATAGMAAGTLALLASPAGAGTTGNTGTTFTLTGGGLAITVPATKALGSVATGAASTTAAQLGAVSVTDSRGALLGAWTVSVTSTDFVTGASTANETIADANASYWSGAASATSGVGTFTPGQVLAANAVTLGTSQTAFSAAAVVGNNTATWNPTLNINIPSSAVAGVYTGTITHSVA